MSEPLPKYTHCARCGEPAREGAWTAPYSRGVRLEYCDRCGPCIPANRHITPEPIMTGNPSIERGQAFKRGFREGINLAIQTLREASFNQGKDESRRLIAELARQIEKAAAKY